MKAIIVSCFDTYLERVRLLKEYYQTKGFETLVVLSDFRHIQKEKNKDVKKDYIYIETKPYYKNLSIVRLYSHYCFAKNSFKIIEKLKPDILHVLIPANSLAKEAAYYKKKNPDILMYFDLIDLWPETMPIPNFLKNKFPFNVWKLTRDRYLDKANIIFTECNLYKKILHKETEKNYKTLYWAKYTNSCYERLTIQTNTIHLCYLGSINNIIDIDVIIDICIQISKIKPIVLHIIGNGEKKNDFISSLKKNNIEIIDHGTIYDQKQKQRIFDVCHFGLNIMKNSVCVGLTMKSLDYFQAGLPIINNIKGDTMQLVEEFHLGFNISNNISNIICSLELNDYVEMRTCVIKAYEKLFSKEAFNTRINNLIDNS